MRFAFLAKIDDLGTLEITLIMFSLHYITVGDDLTNIPHWPNADRPTYFVSRITSLSR